MPDDKEMTEVLFPMMTKLPATYTCKKFDGVWEKLTGAEAKADDRDCIQAFYDGRALGWFAEVK